MVQILRVLDARVPAGGLCSSLNPVEAASSLDANRIIQGLLVVSELPADVGNSGSVLRPRVSVTVKGLLEVHYFYFGVARKGGSCFARVFFCA